MLTYETDGSDGSFCYRLEYSKCDAGWSLESMQVKRVGESVLLKRGLKKVYRTEALAIAYGINSCEDMVSSFTLGALSWNEFMNSHGQLP
ncbi:hypothetical protein J2X56_002996 [Herbaspirillum sp. 1173]|nr:hypothetical protein [Herbaspirillum sp. 1173]